MENVSPAFSVQSFVSYLCLMSSFLQVKMEMLNTMRSFLLGWCINLKVINLFGMYAVLLLFHSVLKAYKHFVTRIIDAGTLFL